jgi:hypothetical protein
MWESFSIVPLEVFVVLKSSCLCSWNRDCRCGSLLCRCWSFLSRACVAGIVIAVVGVFFVSEIAGVGFIVVVVAVYDFEGDKVVAVASKVVFVVVIVEHIV